MYGQYCKVYAVHVACFVVAIIATNWFTGLMPMKSSDWLHLILRAIVVTLSFTIIMLACMLLTRCAVTRFLARFGLRL